jgi:signal transduction histidine kinase
LAAVGFLLGVIAAVLAMSAGVQVSRSGDDLTLVAALVVEGGLALAGFVVGRGVEARAMESRRLEFERRSVEDLAALQARLADARRMATIGQLAAMVAHEVRNPLAIIRSMVQNLSDDPAARDDQIHQTSSRALLEEIDRLSRVTAMLVGLTRPTVPRLAPVDPGVLLTRAEWLGRRLLDGRSLMFTVRQAGPPAACVGDLDLLCQVLLELVANAAHATPEGGTICLESRNVGDAVVLTVTDSGPGIPRDLRERIFESFFTTRAGGTGIGLAVARDIVVKLGGTIEIGEPQGDGGACVIVRMPAAARA